jgi:hypothetical protein
MSKYQIVANIWRSHCLIYWKNVETKVMHCGIIPTVWTRNIWHCSVGNRPNSHFLTLRLPHWGECYKHICKRKGQCNFSRNMLQDVMYLHKTSRGKRADKLCVILNLDFDLFHVYLAFCTLPGISALLSISWTLNWHFLCTVFLVLYVTYTIEPLLTVSILCFWASE